MAGLAALRACGASAVADDGAGAVVIELFTSQGCSSCPAADALLSRLGLEDAMRARVVPLAFHVDYWNVLGWSDPWSSREWSLRQADYCRALAVEDGPYTPQLVVNGRLELNGTDERRLRAAIAAARGEPARARVTLALREDAKGRLSVSVAARVDAAVEARRLELLVALFESGLTTAVGRGENRGRTLRDDFVVRRLERALSLPGEAGARGERTIDLKPGRGSMRANLGVAALLQDPATMRIYAAAVAPVGPGAEDERAAARAAQPQQPQPRR
jgi:hypothetical protein